MIRITIRAEGLEVGSDRGAPARILARFQEEAGKLIVERVREKLGSEEIYALSERYKLQKPRRKGFVRFQGKPDDQPLIFSGNLYNAIAATAAGDMIVIQVEDGKALAKNGDDYAQMWEDETHYLELGLQDVEGELPGLLERIIVEEMHLGT